jgi:hypothetical protein
MIIIFRLLQVTSCPDLVLSVMRSFCVHRDIPEIYFREDAAEFMTGIINLKSNIYAPSLYRPVLLTITKSPHPPVCALIICNLSVLDIFHIPPGKRVFI